MVCSSLRHISPSYAAADASGVTALHVSPDEKRIYAGGWKQVNIWDTATRTLLSSNEMTGGQVRSIITTPDDKVCFVTGSGSYVDASFVGAELLDVPTAIKAGFLDEAVPADQLMARAMEKAKAFQELHPKAYAGNKKLVRGAAATKIQIALANGGGITVNV